VVYGQDKDGNKFVNQYVIVNDLGTGAYGKVKLSINTENNQFYALKIMKKSVLKKRRVGMKKGAAFENVMQEINIMKKLTNKYVVKLFEIIDDPNEDRLFMVIEYLEGGTVMSGELESEPLPEMKAQKYFRDVVTGLEYVHSQKVIHRDIKPENLLVAADGTVKISDFGVSYVMETDEDEALRKTVGTPAFLAPELCAAETTKICGTSIDIWALGVTLFFFIFGKCPFMAETEVLMYEKIRSQELELPSKVSSDLEDLLRKLLNKDPLKRITIPEIKKQAWFRKSSFPK